MDKNEQLIMVVSKATLLANYFRGFRSHDKGPDQWDYEKIILKNHAYMKRGLAEDDIGFKQPIAYGIIMDSRLGKVFAYQRASDDAKYEEKRLQGKWSIGVGGHIYKNEKSSESPIMEGFLRELKKEVTFDGSCDIKPLGYINYDSDDVGQVHFGILYLVETNAPEIFPKDPEIAKGRLFPFGELELMVKNGNAEEWTKIAFGELNRISVERKFEVAFSPKASIL